MSWQLFAFEREMYKNGVIGTYGCLECWVCDGYTGGYPDMESNNRKWGIMAPLAASLAAYHLFGDGDHLHVVVEESAGHFRHLSFGFIDKAGGAWSGGQYISSGCPIEMVNATANAFATGHHMLPFGANYVQELYPQTDAIGVSAVRADIDGVSVGWRVLNRYTTQWDDSTGKHYGLGAYTNHTASRGGAGSGASMLAWLGDLYYNCSPQGFNGVAPMARCHVFAFRWPWAGAGNVVLLGEFPNVRFLNMANLEPGEEITLGADTWKVFPIYQKAYIQGPSPISWDFAIAYKKVTS